MRKIIDVWKVVFLGFFIVSLFLCVFTIKNLVGGYYISGLLRYVILFSLIVSSTLFLKKTKYKKYDLLLGCVIWLVFIVLSSLISRSIRRIYNDKYGAVPSVFILVEKRIISKAGTDGYFKSKNSVLLKRSLPVEVLNKIDVNDTVIFIESIKLKGQYDVLNYFPSSEEISKAKKHKYYYKGEYVNSLPK